LAVVLASWLFLGDLGDGFAERLDVNVRVPLLHARVDVSGDVFDGFL
jgi:hypothetical protein